MVDKQIDMLSADLAKHPNAIGFAALDSKAAIPLLKKAQAEKIPVIAFDSGVDSDIPLTTCATDNIAAAAVAADKMAEMIGDSGEVAVVVHDQTSRTGIDRRDGFLNEMKAKHPNVKIVSVQYGGGDQLKSTEITKAILQANPNLKGIFGANEGSIIGVLHGVKESKKKLGGHRLRFGQGADRRDQVRRRGRRDHPEPDRHRLLRRRIGGEGAEGRQAAQDGRYRLLLVRQVERQRPKGRRRSIQLKSVFRREEP